jgi:hypothetical protein
MHSRIVESEGCHFMFYGVFGLKVDCRVGSDWFSIYVYFEVCLIACYFQVKEVYGIVGFVCGVKFYLVMNLIYVCVDCLGMGFCYVIFIQHTTPTNDVKSRMYTTIHITILAFY